VLRFTNLNPGDVQLSRSGSHMWIDIVPTGARITADYQFWSTSGNWGIDRFEFANATIWDRATIMANVAIRGTSGNDSLSGSSGNDLFVGGLGNDYFSSGPGADTYVYASGDGNDEINDDEGSTSLVDVLRLTNLNPGDVALTRSGSHLFIQIVPTGASIKANWQYWSASGNWGLDRFDFADGTVWDRAEILRNTWQYGGTGNDNLNGWGSIDSLDGLGGNDSISGNAGADRLVGGPGNDLLSGGTGDDTYLFGLGDGSDTINEEGEDVGSADGILFGSGISASDLNFSRSGNSLVVQIAGTSDQITIQDGLWSAFNNPSIARDRVEYFDLANGARVTLADVQLALLNGTSGNDSIAGYLSNDTLEGKAGNDTLAGGGGNDTFVFNAGFGQDTITDFAGGAGTGDVIDFQNSLFADYVALQAASQQVGNDVLITVDVANSILLKNVMLTSLNQDDFLFH
jgi:Ca2+-binding RTX toxin-like protein